MKEGCLRIYLTSGKLISLKNHQKYFLDDLENEKESENFTYPDVQDFVKDQAAVMYMMSNGPCKSYC